MICSFITGSGQGSDAGGRLGASILSEHGDATLISPSRARPKLTMRLPAPSELLIDGAEGADEVSRGYLQCCTVLLGFPVCRFAFIRLFHLLSWSL